MDRDARRALREIKKCMEAGRVVVLAHFVERMDLRGLFGMDIVDVIESPQDVRDGGSEELGRPRWIIVGTTADALKIEIVCVIEEDDMRNSAVFCDDLLAGLAHDQAN
jgi:hypothetical protein